MKRLKKQWSEEGETNSMFGGTVSSEWIHRVYDQFKGENNERSE